MDFYIDKINRCDFNGKNQEEDLITILSNKETYDIYQKNDYINSNVINNNQDNTQQYLKPWAKLDKLQKINRLMAYINKLKTISNKSDLIRNLIKLINEKNYKCKKNDIIYDESKGEIVEIKNLNKTEEDKYFIGSDITHLNIKTTVNNNKVQFKKIDFKSFIKSSQAPIYN
jgi:hypothetical protein